jgi:hypothetical protein
MPKEDKFDVAIIGAGPAGIMSAIQAARKGLRVVLIEKNKQLGKKLLLTGGGRCNLTNAEFSAQGEPASGWNLRNFVENYNKGEFLFHAFSIFGPKEVINFFNGLGVETKIETGKRVFPKNEDSEEVLKALEKELEKLGVKILYNSEVVGAEFKNKKISKLFLKAKKYILCTGGKSYPKTGSDGFGFQLAEKLGHTIVKPSPALCPIRLSAQGGPASGWKNLQGISLKNICINVLQNNKKKFSECGEILFTHYGISGPAILNASGKIGALMETGKTKISIDLFPALNHQEVLKSFKEILQKYPKQTIKNILSEFAQERLAEVLLDVVKIDRNKIGNNLSKIERSAVVKILKNLEMTAEDVMGFDNAMATSGGISLKEIDHKTMKSKIIDNLFFAGEIIDVDGKTGGFNLQMCWSTGYIAGQSLYTPEE